MTYRWESDDGRVKLYYGHATRSYRCTECGAEIPKYALYEHFEVADEGEVTTYCTCPPCVVVRELLSTKLDEMLLGAALDDLRQYRATCRDIVSDEEQQAIDLALSGLTEHWTAEMEKEFVLLAARLIFSRQRCRAAFWDELYPDLMDYELPPCETSYDVTAETC